jgi:two-component system, chemotaxis family, CheB/CheR fusion protein
MARGDPDEGVGQGAPWTHRRGAGANGKTLHPQDAVSSWTQKDTTSRSDLDSGGDGELSDSDDAPDVADDQGPPPLVAIGSSAGGYEATKELFADIPSDTGMAFVLIPHLDPDHESHLADLLRRHANLPVTEATEGVPIEPDHVYVIPPDTSMMIEDGTLSLAKRVRSKHVANVIDQFFRAVADAYGELAVGVVLSGALADGTQGIRDIKTAGGFALAQDPETATFPDMPRSAIETGMVDVVASPGELGAALVDLAKKRQAAHTSDVEDQEAERSFERSLEKVLSVVQRVTDADFQDYKRSTLMRRIQRRIIATRNTDLASYAKHLAANPEEAEKLHRELLILVTRFFRDAAITKAVEEEVLPSIFKNRPVGEPLRVWVAGCSTGEEAYSLAILITEYLERNDLSTPLTIFATDLSAQAIRTAREGVYPETIKADVSQERLARFFESTGPGYRIRKDIRGVCVFAEHNLVQDPPFSNMDIASCRNVLVYMRPRLQRRALEALHYSLKRDGVLILGNAESIGRNKDLFSPVTDARNVLTKRPGPDAQGHNFMTRHMLAGGGQRRTPTGITKMSDVSNQVDRLLLDRYAPPGVVVDPSMKVLHFRGQTADFLKHPAGPASLDLRQLVPESVALMVRDLMRKAERSGVSERRKNLTFEHHGSTTSVELEVVPLRPKEAREKYYLVTFAGEAARPSASARTPRRTGLLDALFGQDKKELEQEAKRLQTELKEAREQLKHVVADHDAATEELRSTNEEIVSTNEELQSANEELETTKEELQSTNEELTTLNEELHNRNKNLQEVNNDLVNLLQSVELPIIMLGPDLTVRRFTPRAKELFKLLPHDVDRPLMDIQTAFDASSLKADLLGVLATHEQATRVVEAEDGRHWLLKIHPYRTAEDTVDGLVVVASEGKGDDRRDP